MTDAHLHSRITGPIIVNREAPKTTLVAQQLERARNYGGFCDVIFFLREFSSRFFVIAFISSLLVVSVPCGQRR